MSTMIQSLFVKSSFVPDESRTSKRKSEEIKLAPLLTTETGAGTIRSGYLLYLILLLITTHANKQYRNLSNSFIIFILQPQQ